MQGERTVTAALSVAYSGLTAEQARLYRLLGLFPGPSLDIGIAVCVAGAAPETTEDLLDTLEDAALLEWDEESRPLPPSRGSAPARPRVRSARGERAGARGGAGALRRLLRHRCRLRGPGRAGCGPAAGRRRSGPPPRRLRPVRRARQGPRRPAARRTRLAGRRAPGRARRTARRRRTRRHGPAGVAACRIPHRALPAPPSCGRLAGLLRPGHRGSRHRGGAGGRGPAPGPALASLAGRGGRGTGARRAGQRARAHAAWRTTGSCAPVCTSPTATTGWPANPVAP